MEMEVDGIENFSNPSEGGKFSNLKAFVTAAREFEATHSESAVNLMTRYLGVSLILCLLDPVYYFHALNFHQLQHE